jgi:adenylate kinase
MKLNAILLFGAPGAGKGTQGKVLGTVPGFIHCACGEVFRNLTVDSELGRTFLDYSGRGELVPDEYTVRLWRQAIDARIQTGSFRPEKDTLVLDGIPRSLSQAQMLVDTLNVLGVFYLTCSDRSKLILRMQRRALRDNRLDDANYEVILQRLETYERETKPVLEFYGAHLVHEVDAMLTPLQVLNQILAKMANFCVQNT